MGKATFGAGVSMKALWLLDEAALEQVHPEGTVVMGKSTPGKAGIPQEKRGLIGKAPLGAGTPLMRFQPLSKSKPKQGQGQEFVAMLSPVAWAKGTGVETVTDITLSCCNPFKLHVVGLSCML